MSIARDFFEKLQNMREKEPLVAVFLEKYIPYRDELTFETILNAYAKYVSGLSNPDKEKISSIFWEQVKFFGTPIIEDDLQDNSKCHVYFLFPKDKISASSEQPETKKDLYLQGDFHGYGVTNDRQRLSELSDTGIMWRKDIMPKEAIVVYKYIQVEPTDKGITPKPELPPFFKKDNERFIPAITNVAEFPAIPSQRDCRDEYSTHVSPFPGIEMPARIFCVSTNIKRAKIQSHPIKWPSLLSRKTSSDIKHFVYHATLYSDQKGDLHRSEAKVTEQYHDDLYYSDRPDSPYVNFTRNIHVFKPASGKIDNIVVINDGIPYLMTGILDHFEKMADEKKLSPNTAFVLISTMPGLKKTLSKDEALAFDKDPLSSTPGMGVRVIDYKDKIDQYIDFIAKLFSQLQAEISVPDDPSHRIMIGSSLSGTASIYIGLKRPDLFGAVLVQSPSPANRVILGNVPKEMLTEGNVYLSSGLFEHPNYVAANANVEYAKELSHKLNIPLHIGGHGHEFVAWNEELEQSLPYTFNMLQAQSLMQAAYIPGMSIATISQGNAIQAAVFGYTDFQSKSRVNSDTQFWACSLSKPVFAYLVLKLIKDRSLSENFLDEKLPWDEKQLGSQGNKQLLTPRMILSHQTGLPNEKPMNFKFNPGEGFRYSGEGYIYLQTIIEKKTKKSLEALAQDKIFGPSALNMTRTTFLFPEDGNKAKTHDEAMVPNPLSKQPANDNNAAGSLHTTASDYALFLMACMNDKDFNELITPQIISMEKDIEAKEKGLDSETLKPIDWGLGFVLQKDHRGEVIAVSHWGHGPGARAFFAIKLEYPQSAIVFLTNSENGLAIAKDIAAPIVLDIAPTMKYLFNKYGYEDIHSPNWNEYHEHLLKGVDAEKKGNFVLAIKSYQEAAKLKPENLQLEYRILHAEAENIQKNYQGNINIKMLKKLAGEYGPLKISVVGSEIRIDDGVPSGPRNLKIINDNLFLDGSVILKFNRDETHNPALLICHFPNGANCSFPPSKNNQSELSVSPKSIFSHTQRQRAKVENEKSRNRKMAKDDTTLQLAKEKKASQAFASKTEKKRATSTDDSNITYRKRSNK